VHLNLAKSSRKWKIKNGASLAMAKGEKVESHHGDGHQQSMHFDKLTFG
jgi:hypothetical protein